jgi:hypothetical protein
LRPTRGVVEARSLTGIDGLQSPRDAKSFQLKQLKNHPLLCHCDATTANGWSWGNPIVKPGTFFI